MTDLVGLLTEVFTWAGLGGGALVLALALAVKVSDGTWLPAVGVVEPTGQGPVVRWFDADGNVNEAPLSDAQVRSLGGADMVDLWYRRGWLGRMRLHPGSRAVSGLLGVAALLLGIGVAATVVQLVVLALD